MQHDQDIRRFGHSVRGSLVAPHAPPLANGERGLQVYRRLIRERTISAVEVTLPRTAQLVGRERLAVWVEQFLAERGSRSPYFRDVSGEIVRWCVSHGAFELGLPPFSADAARFELACFEVNIAPTDAAEVPSPLALDRPLRFARASVLLSCDHGVHRPDGFESPAAEPVQLLIYRDVRPKHVVHLELTDAAARVLRRWRAGATLEVGIKAGLADAAVACNDVTLGEVSLLLADLAERGVVLGAGAVA